MENREIELRAYNADHQKLTKTLQTIGATLLGRYDFKRAVLDVHPIDPNKWIRVRTDGTTTTLAVKQRIESGAAGTGEIEIQTNDFDQTLTVLAALNYTPRSIQENRRTAYDVDGVEVSLDSWPYIGTIVEIEADSEAAIHATAEKLGIHDLTDQTVEAVYLQDYNIDVKTTPVRF